LCLRPCYASQRQSDDQTENQLFHCPSLLVQVNPLPIPFHFDLRYGMNFPYRGPLAPDHVGVLVVVKQPPTYPNRHILVHNFIEIGSPIYAAALLAR
jgi:hypothetical protein